MKKTLITTVLGVLTVLSAHATETLIISDNTGLAGHEITLTSTTGKITYNGVLGNWSLNVDTGIADPPAGFGHSVTQPLIDLHVDQGYAGGDAPGNVLSILFYADGFGPIAGSLNHKTGGTMTDIVSDVINAQVNGVSVTTQTALDSPFALLSKMPVTAGTGTTLGILATITAGTGPGLTSFDSEITIPDAGMTLALLGSALTGLALFARNRKTA